MICSLVLAHSGRTDGNGGHYNRSTGEYHYHHGHPAHDHENGICPYSYNNKNSSNSLNSSTNEISKFSSTKEKQTTIGEIITNIILFILFGIPYVLGIILTVLSIVVIPLTNLWDWLKKKINKK